MHMEGMQLEMENHVLLKKELEQRMRLAIRESNTMESMLNELDDEYEKAISKIELLEGEVIDLFCCFQPFCKYSVFRIFRGTTCMETINIYCSWSVW